MSDLNPFEEYAKGVSSKNYAGSSGYWGDLGQSQLRDSYRYGKGYTGDLSKAYIAMKNGVQLTPTQRQALEGAGYNVNAVTGSKSAGTWGTSSTSNSGTASNGTTKNAADDWETVTVEKNPMLNSAVKGLYSSYSSGLKNAGTLFDSNLSKWTNKYPSKVESAYNTALGEMDLGKTRSKLSALDAAYKTGLEGEMSGYKQTNADALAAQNAALSSQRSNLANYRTTMDSVARSLAEGAGRRAGSLASLGMGGASSSDAISQAQGAYWSRYAPYLTDILGRQQSIEGTAMDLASQQAAREANRYGYDASALGNIYGAQTGTEKYMQSLAQQYPGMVQNQANAMLAAYQAPVTAQSSTLASQASALANIGQLDEAANYRGLSYKPGVQVSQVSGAAYPVYGAGGYSGVGGGNRYGSYGGNYAVAQPAQSAPMAQPGQMAESTIDPNTGGYRYRGIPIRDNRNPGYWYGGRARTSESSNIGSETPGVSNYLNDKYWYA